MGAWIVSRDRLLITGKGGSGGYKTVGEGFKSRFTPTKGGWGGGGSHAEGEGAQQILR